MRQAMIFLISLGAFFVSATCAAPSGISCGRQGNSSSDVRGVSKTDKLKIVSACCVDGKWVFNIYDGVLGKTITLKMHKKNALGYKVESFDESTQTAVIATPRGKFTVAMNDASSGCQGQAGAANKENSSTNSDSDNGQQNSDDKAGGAPTGMVSRSKILESLK